MKKIIFALTLSFLTLYSCSSDDDTTDTNTDNPEVNLPDKDSDGVADQTDNCPDIANTNQQDIDNDGIGDVCDTDMDGDSILNNDDNCPNNGNTDQKDFDNNDIGDLCDSHLFNTLANPESLVRYNDYYLVSNLGQQLLPDTADGDGFISVVNLDGTGLIESYITGLDSPKGLKIINDQLYVCDLSMIKVYNIETRQMVKSFSFTDENVTLLNDITDLYTDNETVFVTATRTNRIFKLNINTGAKEELMVSGVNLLQTNGLALDTENNLLYMVEFGTNTGSGARIIKIDLTDNSGTILGGNTTGFLYDGVALVGSTLYVSDWSHRLFSLDLSNASGTPLQLQTNLNGPADILYDPNTNNIVIPNMTAHTLSFYSIP